ncbi:DNRLRE domain-containing protein, partial [Sphaerimonospora cavernae]
MTASLVVTTSPTSALADIQPTPSQQQSKDRRIELWATKKKQAKALGKRLEIEELRTEVSTTYANADGKTLRTELYTEPIRVKRDDAWHPVDTTLEVKDGVVKPKMANSGLALSDGGNTVAVSISPTQASSAKRSTAKVSAPNKLSKPKLAGNRALFSSAYGQGADLVVTATPTGYRQEIVIREQPTGSLKFRLPVSPPAGVSFGETTSGTPTLVKKAADGKQDKVADISSVLMQDSVAADATATPEEGRAGRATISVENTSDGQILVITPDPKFLADPAVTYPVTVAATSSDWWEPDIKKGGADTFINDDVYYDSWNNFNLDRILVGKSNSGRVRWRSYIRFPNIPSDSLLRGAKVQNADLTLWNHLSNDCGSVVGSGVTARRVTSPWDEMTMQWASQPSVTSAGADTEYGAYSPDCARGGWAAKEWYLIHSVNGIVQAWADGSPNYGFQLAAGNESDSTNWRRYRTMEYRCCSVGAHPPKLTVDFEPASRIVVISNYSGDAWTTAPSYEKAKQYEANGSQDFPTIEGLTASQVADLKLDERLPAYEIDSSQLEPYPGEEWNPDDNPYEFPEPPIPPSIVETSPVKDATDVPADSSVVVTFSEPVTEATLVMKDPQGAEIAGATTVDGTNKVLTFHPAQSLITQTT